MKAVFDLLENYLRSSKMGTYIKTNHKADGDGIDLEHFQRADTKLDIDKEQWLQKYSSRLLRLWNRWQTPLGIAYTYAEQIRKDLAKFYEDPLKKKFIETTYEGLSLTK